MKCLTCFLIIIALSSSAQEKKIYESDVLKGVTTAKTVTPTEKICFDKRFTFVNKSGARSFEGCFMVNTKLGITGATPISTEGTPDCDLNINEKKFHFMVFGIKGNEYTYFSRLEKKKQAEEGELKHYVRTGNTHRNPLANVLEAKMLYNKQRSQEFCDGKYKAWEYRSADEKDILYLYGKEYPGDMMAYAYLGNYGLGYLKTNKGNYFIMKNTHGQTSFTVTEIEDRESSVVCFDPSLFEVYEETHVVKALEETEKKEQELDRALAKQEDKMLNSNSPCAVKKYELLQYKKQEEQKKKALLEKMKDQTLTYSNQATINSIAKEYSFIEGIKMERRQTEYDLCVLKTDLEKGRFKSGSPNYAKAQEKISCWEQRVDEYKKFEDDIKAIEERNRNDIPKAIREKGEYYKNHVHHRIGELRCR
jgi:hypothetical protein